MIMVDESSSSSAKITWQDVFYVLDLACCCGILFPIMWSIRHLQEAAEVDERGMLKLFISSIIQRLATWKNFKNLKTFTWL